MKRGMAVVVKDLAGFFTLLDAHSAPAAWGCCAITGPVRLRQVREAAAPGE